MHAQDATTLYLFKFWTWVETNRNRLVGFAIIVALAVLVIWFMVSQRAAKEVAAGQALTQVVLSPANPSPDAYLKIAEQYSSTAAGRRAQLLGAAALFDAGKFAEAQTAFQKYLDAHPDGEFSGQAGLGVAASLEAQGKKDLAASAYQRLINTSPDVAAVGSARFSLARIDESLGRFNDALGLYQDIVNNIPGTLLASEAAMRMMDLKNKLPSATPAPAPASARAVVPAVPAKSGQ